MTVKQIVAAVHIGQSTVSAHLKQECFPAAADLVMGQPSPAPPAGTR